MQYPFSLQIVTSKTFSLDYLKDEWMKNKFNIFKIDPEYLLNGHTMWSIGLFINFSITDRVTLKPLSNRPLSKYDFLKNNLVHVHVIGRFLPFL